jgi:hypothetical protein
VLVEATGQGPSLMSEIRPQAGMRVHAIVPVDNKAERIRRHLPTIRDRRIELPPDADAPWRRDFIAEMILFPYAGFDDQVDATAQYFDWVVMHPNPPKRPSQALAVAVNSRGMVLPPAHVQPTTQTRGMVVIRRSWW